MSWLAANSCWRTIPGIQSSTHLPFVNSPVPCCKFIGPKICRRFEANVRAFANQNSVKKSRRKKEVQKTDKKLQSNEGESYVQDNNEASSLLSNSLDEQTSIASRRAVLQACTVTSGLIAASGVIIRQVSHIASMGGWPIVDCSSEISFSLEIWHLELIIGLAVLISSCRFLLLKTWPDFAESSDAANQQVLTSLQPLDYIVVSVLPGFSEELLFRGALLPLFGISWQSVAAVSVLFGILHLGGGRKYSFALWATFVGFAYGYATISSSSIIVPMASHAINNLVGGIIWRYSSNSSK